MTLSFEKKYILTIVGDSKDLNPDIHKTKRRGPRPVAVDQNPLFLQTLNGFCRFTKTVRHQDSIYIQGSFYFIDFLILSFMIQ